MTFKMQGSIAVAIVAMLAVLVPRISAAPSGGARIEWDASTLVRVQGGTYGRMARLKGGDILCSYEAGGKCWVSRSRDNGKAWQEPVLVKSIEGAFAANPELLPLHNGRVLLFFNQRPHQPGQAFAIGFCFSDDNGSTWREGKTIYQAGQEARVGCWEPAAMQLPNGEIHLFFANEFRFPDNDDQEITLMRSLDGGSTWGTPETVSHRAGHRDGMPVPLLLQDGKTLALAIEDNGLAPGNSLQPAVITSTVQNGWRQGVVDGASAQRWGAIVPALRGDVYAGAPYLRQMPGGETILSCQSSEGGREKPQMVVYVGDAQARNFGNPSAPFSTPGEVSGMWNSLFVKDADTITALSDTAINGVRGLWSIDGRIVRGH